MSTEQRVPDPAPCWRAYESSLAHRDQQGTLGNQALQAVEEPNWADIDLGFDSDADAEAFLAELRTVWSRTEGKVTDKLRAPVAEIADCEARDFAK